MGFEETFTRITTLREFYKKYLDKQLLIYANEYRTSFPEIPSEPFD